MIKDKKKLCAYVRVGSIEQKENHQDTVQIEAINNWIAENGQDYEIAHIFQDLGLSSYDKRPEYEEMVQMINEFDGIIATRMTVLNRDVDNMFNLINLLINRKKELIIVESEFKTHDPHKLAFFEYF